MKEGPQHPVSFSSRSPRLFGYNLPSPGNKKIIIQMWEIRIKKGESVKSGSCAPFDSSFLSSNLTNTYFQVSDSKKEKPEFSENQPRGSSERCSPDLSSVFQFSSLFLRLSLAHFSSLSFCSQRLTDRHSRNVRNTRRAAKVTAEFPLPKFLLLLLLLGGCVRATSSHRSTIRLLQGAGTN